MNYTRTEVIYGRTFGTALTMDIFTPTRSAKNIGIIFFMSEGWYSEHDKITDYLPIYIEPLINNGFTVFTVIHGSNPKFSLDENVAQAHRAVRFVRNQAAKFGISPTQIGAIGDSAGGHLSLMVGSGAMQHIAEPQDTIDQTSSKVQAVVAFFPPTDFLNWGSKGTLMLGNHPKVPLKGAFDFKNLDPESNSFVSISSQVERLELGRLLSPISHISNTSSPTLIVYGDQDSFIPIQQSISLGQALEKAKVISKTIVHPGGEHDELTVKAHINDAIAWFDDYLTH